MANMGNCLRCCCLLLPISWTLSAFVLVIWILVGSTTTAPFPADTYFIRLNTSAIDPAGVTALPGYTIAETLGLHDFYQTGLWNYCEGYYRLDQDWEPVVTACGPQSENYYFDPIAIMSTELMSGYSIVFVNAEVDAIQKVKDNASWLRAAFVITALFTGFTLVIGPMTGVWHERPLFNCIPVGCMCTAAFFWFIGAITATNVYLTLRNAFNNDARLHVQANLGHQMFAWVWLGVWVSTVAAWLWCCAAICCPGGHRKRRIHRKKVFTGLPAIPWVGSHVDQPSASMSETMVVQQHHIPVMPTAPLVGAGVGLGLADHSYQQNQPMQSQSAAPAQHHGHMGEVIAGTALLGAGAEALHHHHQQQQQQQAPPPQHHNHALQHGVEGVAGLAAAGALLEHQHHQHQQQQQMPQPPPQHHQLQHGLEAAAGMAAAGALLENQHLHHQQQQQQMPQAPPQHHALQHGIEGAAGMAAAAGLLEHEHHQHQQQQAAAAQQQAQAAQHHHQQMQMAEAAAAGVAVGAAAEAMHAQHQQQMAIPQPIIPPQQSGGNFVFDAGVSVAEGAAAANMLGRPPMGPPPNGRPPSGRPPSRPPPPAVIVPQPPGVQMGSEPLAFPAPFSPGPGGPPMMGVGPLIQGQPPNMGPIPPNAQPIPLDGGAPAVGMPGMPDSSVRPDGSLQSFPYAPGQGMIANDINSLFGRDSHR